MNANKILYIVLAIFMISPFASAIVFKLPNQVTTFSESGLPSGGTFMVSYNNVTQSTTNTTLSFTTAPGNYSYFISDYNASGVTYTPSPQTGYLVANTSLSASFTPSFPTTTVPPSNTTNTTATTSIAPATIAAATTVLTSSNGTATPATSSGTSPWIWVVVVIVVIVILAFAYMSMSKKKK